jgi:transposase
MGRVIAEQVFHQLLNLGEGWEVRGVDYESEANRFVIVIGETEKLWSTQVCPQPSCRHRTITCYDHADTRSWRHLDVFGKRSEILCAVPRGRCARCAHVSRVPVPWEGEGKHFTQEFEAFALTLMREMPVSKAGEIVGETDPRLWRMLFAHVDKAYAALDMSEVCWIGVDEMNCRKGHDYLTVFADLVKKRVLFATEGKDAQTFRAFVEALGAHNGHPKAITQAAIDMSPAYQKGVREELPNAAVVFDKFHVVAQVSGAVDAVRRLEARSGDAAATAPLKKSLWLWRKNPENLTEKEAARLAEMDLKHLATGQAYQMRLVLQEAYASRRVETARYRFEAWVNWVQAKCDRLGAVLEPMRQVAAMVERHLEGILAHWQAGLTTGFLEGLNSVFSATKRKARGYRSREYMITMLYFVAGKLSLPSPLFH